MSSDDDSNSDNSNREIPFEHVTIQNSIPNFSELTRGQRNRIKNALSILNDPIKFIYYVYAMNRDHRQVNFNLIKDLCIASPYEFVPSNMFDPKLEECDEDGIYNLVGLITDQDLLDDNNQNQIIEMNISNIFGNEMMLESEEENLDEIEELEDIDPMTSYELRSNDSATSENDSFDDENVNNLFDEIADQSYDGQDGGDESDNENVDILLPNEYLMELESYARIEDNNDSSNYPNRIRRLITEHWSRISNQQDQVPPTISHERTNEHQRERSNSRTNSNGNIYENTRRERSGQRRERSRDNRRTVFRQYRRRNPA